MTRRVIREPPEHPPSDVSPAALTMCPFGTRFGQPGAIGEARRAANRPPAHPPLHERGTAMSDATPAHPRASGEAENLKTGLDRRHRHRGPRGRSSPRVLVVVNLRVRPARPHGKTVTVKIGTTEQAAPYWAVLKKAAAKDGIDIQVVGFSDYTQANPALARRPDRPEPVPAPAVPRQLRRVRRTRPSYPIASTLVVPAPAVLDEPTRPSPTSRRARRSPSPTTRPTRHAPCWCCRRPGSSH